LKNNFIRICWENFLGYTQNQIYCTVKLFFCQRSLSPASVSYSLLPLAYVVIISHLPLFFNVESVVSSGIESGRPAPSATLNTKVDLLAPKFRFIGTQGAPDRSQHWRQNTRLFDFLSPKPYLKKEETTSFVFHLL
jgi:hypothetical protein